jgi:hypothetical protein
VERRVKIFLSATYQPCNTHAYEIKIRNVPFSCFHWGRKLERREAFTFPVEECHLFESRNTTVAGIQRGGGFLSQYYHYNCER